MGSLFAHQDYAFSLLVSDQADLMRLQNRKLLPLGLVDGPGMSVSTGTILSVPPQTQYKSWKIPPSQPQAP